jgi:acyl-CoA hydrolase
MTEIVLPSDANALGTAFGGKIMQWIDIAAAVAARRHCRAVAVTASIDSLHFDRPIMQGDVVVLRAAVNRAWRTSLEVGVRLEGESLEERFLAATAYLTFVAIDGEGKRLHVPPVAPESADERRRYDKAAQRREQRLKTRAERRERAAEKNRSTP